MEIIGIALFLAFLYGTWRLRVWILGGGIQRSVSGSSNDVVSLSSGQQAILRTELRQRGFSTGEPYAEYSDFDYAGQPAVEVRPVGVGLYHVKVLPGAAKYLADEALKVARNSS